MALLLLISAAGLGLLAFYEPCTIATHTLFLARSRGEGRHQCRRNMLLLWLSRTLLLLAILLAAVMFVDNPQWEVATVSTALFLIAVIYLVSRFVYLPIPHLEFFRLIPGNKRLPEALRLGLTLPACTIPLVVLIAAMAVVMSSVTYAVLAAVIFATLFSLPMFIYSVTGLGEEQRDFLQRAAASSPYLSALFISVMAIYIASPSLDINIQQFKDSLQQASLAGIGISFIAGFIFSFNPVSFASIPVMLAYVTKSIHDKENQQHSALVMGGAFVLGMVVTHAVLGVIAALGGDWVKTILGREWGLLLGPVLILLGLMWPGWITIRLPWFGIKGKKVSGIWGAFLLGIPFSVAVCPFCTPALLVALTASAAIGSVSFGFALLLAFALGRSIPVILGAWSMGWLESLKVFSHYQKTFEVIAGIVLVVMGLYLLNEYFFII